MDSRGGATTKSALIFDLDGVLTNTVEFHYQSWNRLANDLGFSFSRRENEKLRGLSRAEALELFLAGRCREYDSPSLMEQKNRYFLEAITGLGPHDLEPGVAELLDRASREGVPLGLASSSRNARLVAQRLGIHGRFDAFADGCSGLRPKPAPDLFVWVAGQLGLPPGSCVVVEDAEAGVEAALAGGFRVVGLGPAERVGDAHLVLPDLAGATLELLLGLDGTGAGQ